MPTADQREDNRRSQNRVKSVRPGRRCDEILTEWRSSQRAYRERRHRYVTTLETQVDATAAQNDNLREENDDLAERLMRLRAQNMDIHAAHPQELAWDEEHARVGGGSSVEASGQGQATRRTSDVFGMEGSSRLTKQLAVPHRTRSHPSPFERSREARVSYAGRP